MRKAVLLIAVLGCGSSAPIARPAGRVLTYATSMQGQAAGGVTIELAADGTRTTSTIFRVRGTQEIVKTVLRLDEAGAPSSYVATGVDHFGQAIEERLTAGPALRWRSTTEQGQAAAGAGFYAPLADSVDVEAALARAVLRAPGHRVALLPSGEAWLEDQATRRFGTWTLRRVAIAGLGFEPAIVWLDAQGELFAVVSAWSATVRTGAEALAPRLLADQQAWTTARAAQLAGTLAHHPPAAGLAITHARVFDAVSRSVREDQTVLVIGETIAAVGHPAIPAGAQVIDAHGRTLIPGLWDMHVHLHDTDGTLHLASGVTTVRDLGNDFDDLNARVARYRAGTELGPSVLRAGLIDGPSPHSAGLGVVVATADEARAAVARYADAGYVQVKLYNSLAPALVPVIAQAAHARGLRVSGHVPNTMNAAQAVEAGYDELQHTNFLFLRFLAGPTDDTRTMLRVTRVAERGAELDLTGPDVARFLELLVAHHTVVDATLTVFHNMFTADPGELDPVFTAYAARLPSQIVRSARAGGLAADAAHRARYRASFAAMQRLIKLAWDRKIPIDTGTDYYAGVSLPHELELLVEAGIPAAEVLAMATLGDARIMHAEREVGTIAAGQRADLVLLDGDPTRDIRAVRNADAVIRRGVVYDPGELYASVGMRAARRERDAEPAGREDRGPRRPVGRGRAQRLEPVAPDDQGHDQLDDERRQAGRDARARAAAVREVGAHRQRPLELGGPAFGPERGGLGVVARVAVHRPRRQEHPRAGRDRDPGHDIVDRGAAGEHAGGRAAAQRLLHDLLAVGEAGQVVGARQPVVQRPGELGGQLAIDLGVLGDQAQGLVDRDADRLIAGRHHRDQLVADLAIAQRLAVVVLHRQEAGHQIAAGGAVAPAGRDPRHHLGVERGDRGVVAAVVRGRRPLGQHEVAQRADRRGEQPAEPARVLAGRGAEVELDRDVERQVHQLGGERRARAGRPAIDQRLAGADDRRGVRGGDAIGLERVRQGAAQVARIIAIVELHRIAKEPLHVAAAADLEIAVPLADQHVLDQLGVAEQERAEPRQLDADDVAVARDHALERRQAIAMVVEGGVDEGESARAGRTEIGGSSVSELPVISI